MFVIWYKMYRNSVEMNSVVVTAKDKGQAVDKFDSLMRKNHHDEHTVCRVEIVDDGIWFN